MTDQSKVGGDARAEAAAEVGVPVEVTGAEVGAEVGAEEKAPRRRKPNKAKVAAEPEPRVPLHFADCSPVWRSFYEHIAKGV